MDFTNIKTILILSRPRFWIYLAGTFLIAYTSGISNISHYYSFNFVYGFIYFLIPANIFLYGVNDLADKDTDKYNKKKSKIENRLQNNQSKIYLLSIITSLILSIPLFVTGNYFSNIFLAGFFLLGYFYSCPPIRFKSKIYLDFLSNCLYVFPGIVGYSLITNSFPNHIFLSASFLWCFAMHLFSAVPDIVPDTKAGLNTSAVHLGYKNSLILCSLFWSVTFYLTISKSLLFLPLIIYPILPMYILTQKASIDKTYWKFPIINMVIGGYIYFVTIYINKIITLPL